MIAGSLEVEMFANIARISKDMQDTKGIVGNAMGSVEKSVQSAKNVLASLGVGLSVGVMVNKFQQIAIETDKLRGNLVTMTGSSEAAGIAFDSLTKFAAKTPFTLDQSVNAFIKLKALGLDPSERALMSYGNTSAAMGKNMSQMIEAVADASTFQFERLLEFGIKAKQEGENVSFTFQGVTTTVAKESDAIQGYLLDIGETKFGDAMSNQMERLTGKLSNLGDNVDGFYRKIGDAGGIDLFGRSVDLASGAVLVMTENLDDVGIAAGGLALIMTTRLIPAVYGLSGPIGIAVGAVTALVLAFKNLQDITNNAKENSIARNISGGVDLIQAAMIDVVKHINEANTELENLGSGRSAKARREQLRQEIGNLTGELERYAEALNDTRNPAAAVEESTENLGGSYLSASEELKLFNESIKEYLEEQKREEAAREKQAQAILDTIAKLEQQQAALGMTQRAQAIFNATLQAANDNALPEQIANIATLTAQNYDLAESQRIAGEAAKAAAAKAERASQEAAKAAATAAADARKAWLETHEYLSDAFVDIMDNGGNAFDNIADAFEKTVKRMVAEWAASGLMSLFTGGGLSGFTSSAFTGGAGGALGGVIGSLFGGGSSNAVVSEIAKGGVGGLAGTAGAAGGTAGSAITGAIGAIPGWGWALGGAALAAKLLDSGGTMSGNAGFLIRGVGNGDRQFDVPAFDSGFDPVGFARREDQGTAVQVIDTFRQYDSALTAIAKASGLNVNYNSNNFGGFNEKGNGNGLFFGTANEDGSNTAVGVDQQLSQFVGQWIKGLSGQVDQSLINDVLAAGDADSMIQRAAQIAGYDGSHASGLDYVPFDGYRAKLHRGERVQTASQARADDSQDSKDQKMLQVLSRMEQNTKRTSDLLMRVTRDGNSLVTVAA